MGSRPRAKRTLARRQRDALLVLRQEPQPGGASSSRVPAGCHLATCVRACSQIDEEADGTAAEEDDVDEESPLSLEAAHPARERSR